MAGPIVTAAALDALGLYSMAALVLAGYMLATAYAMADQWRQRGTNAPAVPR